MLKLKNSLASWPKPDFSPAGYRKARKQAENGDWRKLIRMMLIASEDSHVSGCLMARRAGFTRRWTLESPEDYEIPEDRLKWMTATLKRLNMRRLLRDLHRGKLYRYSVIDLPERTEWTLDDGRIYPVTYIYHDQRHFRYDKEGNLRVEIGGRLEALGEDTIVVEHTEPVMLPVLRDFTLKNFGLEAWASLIEDAGSPFLVGYYPANADAEVIKKLEEALAQMQASSRVAMEKGNEFDVKDSNRYSADQRSFVEAADKGISITLLGHANAVQQTASQIGENSSAFKVKREIALDDAADLEQAMQAIIDLIWSPNFDGPSPRFNLDMTPPVDVEQHLKKIATLWTIGAPIRSKHLREIGLDVEDDEGPFQRKTDLSFMETD